MTKSFITLTSLLLATSAFSADLPRKSYPLTPIAVPAGMNWSGFYVGLTAGYGMNQYKTTDNGAWNGFAGDNWTAKNKGYLYGITAGYNYQSGRMVYGIEADYSFSSLNGSGCSSLSVDTCSSAKLKQFGTLRGRVGYAFNSFLLYGTAGLAYTSNSYEVYDRLTVPGAGLMSGSRATTDFGYVLGAGVEWALTRNWSVKGEYLYTPMRSTNVNYLATVPPGFTNSMAIKAESLSLVRLGVNYRF